MALTNPQLRYLRGLAHDLAPVIMVGAKGVSDALVAELENALDHHELVKVRITAGDRDARDAIAGQLVERTGAEKVQRVGNVLSLYRRNRDEPKLELPR
ncbi:MAG TPA: ribosome assembly RNA-binding protein YhbY [Xanthomonadales bacterium]|nr:ribosome assembly RNA-binding protein YhbY [Xanthomonadales bacterium]